MIVGHFRDDRGYREITTRDYNSPCSPDLFGATCTIDAIKQTTLLQYAPIHQVVIINYLNLLHSVLTRATTSIIPFNSTSSHQLTLHGNVTRFIFKIQLRLSTTTDLTPRPLP